MAAVLTLSTLSSLAARADLSVPSSAPPAAADDDVASRNAVICANVLAASVAPDELRRRRGARPPSPGDIPRSARYRRTCGLLSK